MFIYRDGGDRNDANALDLAGREVNGERSEVRGDEVDLEVSRDLEGRKIVGFELNGGRSEDRPQPPRRSTFATTGTISGTVETIESRELDGGLSEGRDDLEGREPLCLHACR